ncbi:hypothetical protein [Pseudomonas sp. E102]|uniref:hypothetical protein n=1 Tax=Pseudomonas sp. E102 TaxID=181579 RepID=UPI0040463A38
MSRFVQLREERNNQRRALADYYNDLQGVAGVIRQGFEDYLDLPEETYLDNNRDEQRYVQIGRVESGAFKRCTLHDLPGEDSWLSFAVALTIDSASNSFPKQIIHTSLKLKKESGGYLVTSDELGNSVRASSSHGSPDFSGLYEDIYQAIKKYFSYRP